VKKTILVTLLLAPAAALLAQPAKKTPPPALKNKLDSVSYAIGQNIAQNLKSQGLGKVNTALILRAMNDVLQSKKQLMTDEAGGAAINQYMMAQKSEKAKANKEAGLRFLAANKNKPGVTTLPSGLQYMVLKNGTDTVKPTILNTVKCHYVGTLIDGTVFDGSAERGPAEFQVGGVIAGWTEALQLMTVGSKWRLFIPSDLAYGDNQAGPAIPPGSTLIFEVELLEIK
jgi:FKBP-type peptidyl-prolyl cis-trans isomerase FklB